MRTTNSSRALLSQRSVESTVRMSRNRRRWIIHIPLKSTKLTPNDIRFGHRAPSAAQFAVGVTSPREEVVRSRTSSVAAIAKTASVVGLGARDARVVGVVLAPDGVRMRVSQGQIMPAPGKGGRECGS
jgi:hypothetical protein